MIRLFFWSSNCYWENHNGEKQGRSMIKDIIGDVAFVFVGKFKILA